MEQQHTCEQIEPCWYAVHTRAKHERAVQVHLGRNGIETFLPTMREIHRWTDRSKVVDVPLFSCYVFVRDAYARAHGPVLKTPGVLGWVGAHGTASVIPDSEIDAVKSLMTKDVPVWPHTFLQLGRRVRVRGGCLEGLEGTLVERKGSRTLVVSIDLIHQSLATTIDGYDVEPI